MFLKIFLWFVQVIQIMSGLQCGQTMNDTVTWSSLQELCVDHEDLMPAVKLVKLLHPELNERAVSQRCYGGRAAVMTHIDIIRWLMKKDKTVRNIMKHF
jgi:hypothetical protein